jgi:hypothetical protein
MTEPLSIWDDPEVKSNDNYIKFDNVGDTVTGKILSIKKHTFDDGKVVPQILLDVAGEEKTLTAGQIRLKAELAEKRPGVGDVLTVTLSDIEKRSGGKTLKHFTVALGGAPAPAATPTPQVAPSTAPAVDAQAAAAALSNLTDEQKRALGIAV